MEIDLNADLGEGYPHDAELLTLVSSASISCGAHAGSESDIGTALRLATKHGVRIGAHPSFPDRSNMGRKVMTMPADELQRSLREQLIYLQSLAARTPARLQFVKPHGALYNQAAQDPALARQLVHAIQHFDNSLTLVALAGSHLFRVGSDAGLATCAEAFVDRAYQADGSLLPRSYAGAVIADTELALQQALSIITDRCVRSHDGKVIKIRADTLCIHGDTPQALSFARALHKRLGESGIRIRSCH